MTKSKSLIVSTLLPALMPALIFGGAMLANPDPAAAARIDARTLTCQQARALVRQYGSVVMTFTNTTYDKVVRNGSYCERGESAVPKFTQTLDLPKCNVGNVCKIGGMFKPLGSGFNFRIK